MRERLTSSTSTPCHTITLEHRCQLDLPMVNATLSIPFNPFTFFWCNCVRQAVTLEHVPRAIAFDVSSAPHQVAVLGFQGAPGGRAAGDGAPLLNAAYDLSRSPVQTFQVRGAPGSFDHIRLQVTLFSQESGYVGLLARKAQ